MFPVWKITIVPKETNKRKLQFLSILIKILIKKTNIIVYMENSIFIIFLWTGSFVCFLLNFRWLKQNSVYDLVFIDWTLIALPYWGIFVEKQESK